MNFPNIRLSDICPLCQEAKDKGLIACWPCFRSYELRNGNEKAERFMVQVEERLAKANLAREDNTGFAAYGDAFD